jgi:hypothetical protein
VDSDDDKAALKADAEWLRALNDALHDAEYAAFLNGAARQPLSSEQVATGMTREAMSAVFGFGENSMLLTIFRMAAQQVDLSGWPHIPKRIHVMSTAIPTVNGFCVKTPNLGDPAVVLNHGLVHYIAIAGHLTLGLTSWTDLQYCDHHPTSAKINGLFRLAAGILERQVVPVLDIDAIGCIDEHSDKVAQLVFGQRRTVDELQEIIGRPGLDPRSLIYNLACTIAEMFIVFHELGHIALGHLNRDDVSYAFGDEIGHKVAVFNRSHDAEFAADTFAFQQMVKHYVSPDGLQQRDVAYGIGCLFILMRAVEILSRDTASDTHPPAVDRWRNIKAAMDEPKVPAALDSIDYFFEWARKVNLTDTL